MNNNLHLEFANTKEFYNGVVEVLTAIHEIQDISANNELTQLMAKHDINLEPTLTNIIKKRDTFH